MRIHHVKAHDGEEGNESADRLAKMGVRLHFKLMMRQQHHDWFKRALYTYWKNRKLDP